MNHIKAVQKMQDYIRLHFEEENFDADEVCEYVGYSRRHADRLFKAYLAKTLQEYIKAVCLSQGADVLLNTNTPIIEVALNSHFESHEGFTRSFSNHFHLTPSEYREKRKLIYLPSQKAQDYFSYCEEMGCEWEGLLNSIPEKLEPAALLELPDFLVEEGFSNVAAGIEVPLDFKKPLPEEYKLAELEECTMLYFQSEPYENEEDFCTAIENVYGAVKKYNPVSYGYRFAYDAAPSLNLGADTSTGAKIAVPVLPA